MTPQWTVWRQDDNGNQFVVAHHDDKGAAEEPGTRHGSTWAQADLLGC
ncbi:hypothetical protein [Catelliglobosispora koreensis]|nr:hypothetical protein [Catelliglobosispora koreensis]